MRPGTSGEGVAPPPRLLPQHRRILEEVESEEEERTPLQRPLTVEDVSTFYFRIEEITFVYM